MVYPCLYTILFCIQFHSRYYLFPANKSKTDNHIQESTASLYMSCPSMVQQQCCRQQNNNDLFKFRYANLSL